jgi:hypothetical protein
VNQITRTCTQNEEHHNTEWGSASQHQQNTNGETRKRTQPNECDLLKSVSSGVRCSPGMGKTRLQVDQLLGGK